MEARLAALEANLEAQQQRHESSADRLCELEEELETLRECLENSGSLSKQTFRSLLSKRRSAVALRAVIGNLELALCVGHCAGAASLFVLGSTSQGNRMCVLRALPMLDAIVSKQIIAVGGANWDQAWNSIDVLDATEGHWVACSPLPVFRLGCAATWWSGSICVVGGSAASVLRPPFTGAWESLPAMPICRTGGAVTSLNRSLFYIVGDWTCCYDPKIEKWNLLPHMRTPRWGCAAVAARGRLYVFGGLDQSHRPEEATSFVESFNARTNLWASRASMPTRRFGCAARTCGDRVYVVGGFGQGASSSSVVALNVAEEFHIATETWTTIAPMPTCRAWCGFAAAAGRLYVMGGSEGGEESLDTVDVFDPVRGVWARAPPMPSRRCPCVAVTVRFR
eukprot:TRINITY_DN58951_c0_g1_i1.p1 TRINITY_DN58951_c0_g1~~TRINITY_DN58951_c0_g1_i1.p1  ORF type:complete len:418 (+),score=58.92 TRINITY_DN58951_c0_g1_i1:71-1255(+)